MLNVVRYSGSKRETLTAGLSAREKEYVYIMLNVVRYSGLKRETLKP